MQQIGIICDWNFNRHTQFKSYFYATETLLGTPKFVNSIADLDGLKWIIIGDDHYNAHLSIWQQMGFIEACNERNIHVLAFTTEKIMNSVFPWNEGNYRVLKLFNNLHHFTIDIDDSKLLGTPIHRVAPSHRFSKIYIPEVQKKDMVLFVGNTGGAFNCYYRRDAVITELKHLLGERLVVMQPNVPNWDMLIRLFSEYKFVLSPIGNGNFFTSRFYEILLAGSIPVHQVMEDTLDYYDIEAKYDDCIFFRDPQKVKSLIDNCSLHKSHNRFFMEDNLVIAFKKIGLL